uniref:Uncharacterized protein n=1 Tax=Panagrolaimus sp. JU765 TaxID=591449 RepID=A0AC34RSF4_9BILA
MNQIELYDTNFPCNDAAEDSLLSWAHNGRQIMYSVYLDENVEDMIYVFVNINDDICEYHIKYDEMDMIYVFVNINDDICEYHIKYDEMKKGSDEIHGARFDRFKGLHLTAPPGYKVVHPFMSVDSAMRTYNYL